MTTSDVAAATPVITASALSHFILPACFSVASSFIIIRSDRVDSDILASALIE